MHDALRMGGCERFGHLPRDVQRLVERQRPPPKPSGEILALDELHHQSFQSVRFLEAVHHADVRMIERGEPARLALEAPDASAILSKRAREDLDGNVASEPSVA